MSDLKKSEALERLRIERRLLMNMAERDVQFGDGWLFGYDVEIRRVNAEIDDFLRDMDYESDPVADTLDHLQSMETECGDDD